MFKVIFSKYSNERISKYRIITQILEDENGNREALKKPLTFDSRKHVLSIIDNHKKMRTVFANSQFQVNRIKLVDEAVHFEYIPEKSLSQYLECCYANGENDKAKEIIIFYVKSIRDLATCDFFITKDFIDVFGEVKTNKKTKSWPLTNIDMTFSNIFIQDSIMKVIDCEWVYNFPIPVDYIIFRSIMSTNIPNREEILDEIGILGVDRLNYSNMEKNFQKMVIGNGVVLSNFVKDIVYFNGLIRENDLVKENYHELEAKYNVIIKEKKDTEYNYKYLAKIHNELKINNDKLKQENICLKKDYSNALVLTKDLENRIAIIENSNAMKVLRIYYWIRDSIQSVFK